MQRSVFKKAFSQIMPHGHMKQLMNVHLTLMLCSNSEANLKQDDCASALSEKYASLIKGVAKLSIQSALQQNDLIGSN